jgi:hypothetical protein
LASSGPHPGGKLDEVATVCGQKILVFGDFDEFRADGRRKQGLFDRRPQCAVIRFEIKFDFIDHGARRFEALDGR